jgi:hypothetical protein
MSSMDDLNRLEAKGLARAKIRSKRRRVAAIRSRTIRGSLALFAVAWAIIFGQLVTGNDPALSRNASLHKPLATTNRDGSASGADSRPPRQSEEESAAPVVVPVEPEVSEEPEAPSEPEMEPEPEPEPAPEPVITAAS